MVHGFELCPKIFEKRGFVTFSLRSTGFLLRFNCKKGFSTYLLIGEMIEWLMYRSFSVLIVAFFKPASYWLFQVHINKVES